MYILALFIYLVVIVDKNSYRILKICIYLKNSCKKIQGQLKKTLVTLFTLTSRVVSLMGFQAVTLKKKPIPIKVDVAALLEALSLKLLSSDILQNESLSKLCLVQKYDISFRFFFLLHPGISLLLKMTILFLSVSSRNLYLAGFSS